jgi:hypothetical protein
MRPRAPCADLSRRDTVARRIADVKGIPWPSTSSHLRCSSQMLVMIGPVTMLGLSRWAGTGGSHCTVQRFFSTAIPWAMLCWVFCRQHEYCPEDVYLLAGDEVVVTKAGKPTYGLDRFFSSMHGKPAPGLAFFTWSLVSVQARRAFPLRKRLPAKLKRQPSSQNPRAPHVVLCSSDLDLAYAPLVDYDGSRFQIDRNFRHAKQYWGLEDFMTVTSTGVTNVVNGSWFMVNVAYSLRTDIH